MHLKREFQPPAEDQERAYEEEETDEIAIEELERKEKEVQSVSIFVENYHLYISLSYFSRLRIFLRR